MIDRAIGALGRISISLLFLIKGINQVFDWRAADQEVSMAFMDWRPSLEGWGVSQGLLNLVYQNTQWLILLAVIGEICGALCLLFGVKLRVGTLFLILVWIPIVIFEHPFWLLDGIQREHELMGFFLNLSVLGGLFSFLRLLIERRRYDRPLLHFRGDE